MTNSLSTSDIQILDMLQGDASVSTAAIAERINISQSPCWRRINKLEQDGYIRGRVALLNRDALGMEVVVFATINLTSTGRQNLMAFEQDIVRHPEVVECYTVTGSADYFLKIVTRDIKHYDRFLRRQLIQIPLVRDVNSNVAVTQIKYTTELPLETQL